MQPEYKERFLSDKMEYYRESYKNIPRWNGQDNIYDKTVVVYGEQGYGDIIQFARYLPILKTKSCKIWFHCSDALHPILLEMGCVENCFEEMEMIDQSKVDYHIPSMSFPFLLDSHEADFPYITGKGYIKDNKFKIGIAWEGNPNHSNNEDRCCPLSVYKGMYEKEDIELYMIQQKVQNFELIKGCEDWEIMASELNNFQDTANLIDSMDLIVSVDTSVMHLAGAMGKKTIGLLSFNHDPRWDLKIDWYPSITFLTQKFHGDWTGLQSQLNTNVAMRLQKWKSSHAKL